MRRVFALLLLLGTLPAQAHHTREHVLGAPSPPPAVVEPAAAEEPGGRRLLWALGPFFLLVAVGALRWGYHRHRDRRDTDSRS